MFFRCISTFLIVPTVNVAYVGMYFLFLFYTQILSVVFTGFYRFLQVFRFLLWIVVIQIVLR